MLIVWGVRLFERARRRISQQPTSKHRHWLRKSSRAVSQSKVMRVDVRILDARLRDQLPAYATAGAADSICVHASTLLCVIEPGATHLVKTGLAIHIADAGYAAMILPALARAQARHRAGNLVGLIDLRLSWRVMVRRGIAAAILSLESARAARAAVIVPVVQARSSCSRVRFKRPCRGARRREDDPRRRRRGVS